MKSVTDAQKAEILMEAERETPTGPRGGWRDWTGRNSANLKRLGVAGYSDAAQGVYLLRSKLRTKGLLPAADSPVKPKKRRAVLAVLNGASAHQDRAPAPVAHAPAAVVGSSCLNHCPKCGLNLAKVRVALDS